MCTRVCFVGCATAIYRPGVKPAWLAEVTAANAAAEAALKADKSQAAHTLQHKLKADLQQASGHTNAEAAGMQSNLKEAACGRS